MRVPACGRKRLNGPSEVELSGVHYFGLEELQIYGPSRGRMEGKRCQSPILWIRLYKFLRQCYLLPYTEWQKYEHALVFHATLLGIVCLQSAQLCSVYAVFYPVKMLVGPVSTPNHERFYFSRVEYRYTGRTDYYRNTVPFKNSSMFAFHTLGPWFCTV